MDINLSNASSLLDVSQSRSDEAQLKAQLKAAGKSGQDARQAAEEFEAVFISTMLASMFEGIKTDGPFGGGHGEQVYRSMLTEEYSNSIAQAGGIGIADSLTREILRLQETTALEND